MKSQFPSKPASPLTVGGTLKLTKPRRDLDQTLDVLLVIMSFGVAIVGLIEAGRLFLTMKGF